MGKIIELRPRDPAPLPSGGGTHPAPGDDAIGRLMESVEGLIRILEASHRRIRVLIDAIPDAEAAARLARDHAMLSAALRDAKAKVRSLRATD